MANKKIKRLKDLLRERKGSHDAWLAEQDTVTSYMTRPGQREGSTGGHGVTQQTRAIEGPTVELFHDPRKSGGYVNPARDLKKGRRLRKELRQS